MQGGESLAACTEDKSNAERVGNATLEKKEEDDRDKDIPKETPAEVVVRLEAAAEDLMKTLALKPGCERAKNKLAVTLVDLGTNLRFVGRGSEAVQKYRESLLYNPNYCAAYYNLGVVSADGLQFNEALSFYEKALDCNPCCVEALCNVGVLKRQLGDLEAACSYYERALRVAPNMKVVTANYAVALSDLGTQHQNAGRSHEALKLYKKAILADPYYADAYYNIGVVYGSLGKFEKSVYNYEMAVHFKPTYAEAWNNLGVVYKHMGSLEQAVACFEKALELGGAFANTMNNLAVLVSMNGQMDRAQSLLRKAVATNPLYAEAHNNLGVVLRDEGILQEALTCYDNCLAICPEAENAAQNRLLALNFSTEHTLDEIQKAHLDWGARIALKHPPSTSHPNTLVKDRKLRIGYVSPDFYLHSVSYYIHSVLKHHDTENFDVFCFANVAKPDSKTYALKNLVKDGHWVDILGKGMDECVELVREKQIDILVDLTGHTSSNRLDIFVKKPAPVQVTWIGYPNTTGLEPIDYRITDAIADPWDVKPEHYAETLYRLPGSFLNYCPDTDPDSETAEKSASASFQTPGELLVAKDKFVVNYRGDAKPIITPPAREKNGYVTFGTFNNMAKINQTVVNAWAEIMAKLPTCRFLLKSKPFAEKRVRDQFLKMFTKAGVDTSSVELIGIIPHHYNHLQAYERIDIALDCWPYAGTTTSCEALWMGVPMITLKGPSHVHNVGVSLVTNIGCPELAVDSVSDYVAAAVRLAQSPDDLAMYRSTLRQKMRESILCDAPAFSRNLATAYREMWEAHCDGRKVVQNSAAKEKDEEAA